MFTWELSVKEPSFEMKRTELEQSLFPIEIEIIKKLYEFCPKAYDENAGSEWNSNRHWTYVIKTCLSELGATHGYLVYPEKGGDYFSGEWMLDLVWVDAKAQDSPGKFDWRATRGLKLACECEWTASEDHILEDFLKLTFILSDLRLFIYTNKLIATEEGQFHPAQIAKKTCPISRGFRYLLIGYPNNAEEKFRIDSWIA